MSENEKVEYEKIEKTKVKNTPKTEEEVQDIPEAEQLVDVKPVKYKKGLMERLVVAIIGPDGLPSIGRRLNQDIVKPALKDMVYETLTNGLRMAVFKDDDVGRRSSGHGRNSVRDSSYSAAPPKSYNTMYGRSKTTITREPVEADRYIRNGGYVDQYLITDRGVAQDILNALVDHVNTYHQVSVATYNKLHGIEGPWTDNDIGWTDLRNARIGTVRGGYVLELPRVEPV